MFSAEAHPTTIKKAIDHFIFKLDPRNNIWKASEADVKAIKQIVEFTEKKHEQQFVNQQLFAKLYIKYYGELIRYYKSSVFDKEPQKEINRILDTPIEHLIQDFCKTVKEVEQFNKLDASGLDYVKQLNMTDEERAAIKLDVKVEEITEEDATTNLTAMINFAIDNY